MGDVGRSKGSSEGEKRSCGGDGSLDLGGLRVELAAMLKASSGLEDLDSAWESVMQSAAVAPPHTTTSVSSPPKEAPSRLGESPVSSAPVAATAAATAVTAPTITSSSRVQGSSCTDTRVSGLYTTSFSKWN